MSNANEPAFPQIATDAGFTQASGDLYPNTYSTGGLTKREHFAALIYQQFLAGSILPPGFDASEQLAFAATRAIEAADALLAELEKSK